MAIRTLGVLTKPDQIEPRCHKNWQSVISGESFALKMGYFMVKNPSQIELEENMSHEVCLRLYSAHERLGITQLADTVACRRSGMP